MSVGRTQRRAQVGPHSPIPDKLYFKIGEVSALVGVQAHVLRYWEKEVPAIRPGKSASNQRRYRRKDVEIFREIRRLLYEERYTLAGARRRIMTGEKGEGAPEAIEAASETVHGDVEAEVETEIELQRLPSGDPEASQPQLGLRFPQPDAEARIEAVREGLRELIRLAGEEA